MTVLYFDEDFRSGTAPRLAALGYKVHTTQWERNFGFLDPDQLLYAVQRGWTMVTHNRKDFQLVYRAWTLWGMQPPHFGILVLAQGPYGDQHVRTIHTFLSGTPALSNMLYLWTEPDDIWQEYVPKQEAT